MFISCSRHLRTFPSVGVQRGWDEFSIQMERTLYFAEGGTGEDSDMRTKPKYFEGGDWFVSLAQSLNVEKVGSSESFKPGKSCKLEKKLETFIKC